jgi:hypothetical protein
MDFTRMFSDSPGTPHGHRRPDRVLQD